jgi:DNA-binding transcriptional MerR regulator/methylmalonyl-CoA mutase cobalamin-binding subunit
MVGSSNGDGDTSAPEGYSIRVASRLSGLSADTLRMWERRYGFPKPLRTANNVRLYSGDEIDKLILVSRALKLGHRAGEVIRKEPGQLRQLLASTAEAPLGATLSAPTIQTLVDALAQEDPDRVRNELRQAAALLGPKRFLLDVAAPLVDEVGAAWSSGRLHVRHEHLLSVLLAGQLRVMCSAYESGPGAPAVVLATLPGELHGLGVEMVALYLAMHGAVPRVLGVDTPTDQIVDATHALGARAVGISVSASADLDACRGQLRWIANALRSDVRIWVGGRRARALQADIPRVRITTTWQELDECLAELLQ